MFGAFAHLKIIKIFEITRLSVDDMNSMRPIDGLKAGKDFLTDHAKYKLRKELFSQNKMVFLQQLLQNLETCEPELHQQLKTKISEHLLLKKQFIIVQLLSQESHLKLLNGRENR